jgi:SpoVK/Ycf46/Vps4 family AAA+-type ATPase
MFAGTGTDTSGVKTALTGKFLSWMQDTGALGELFIGPPGAAKSAMAKSIGNEADVCTVAFDVDAMQSSLVGTSGENLAAGLKVAEAIGQGSVLVIGTCNKINSLPPELRRRFKLATFFFDLPTEDERAAIWGIYRKKFQTTGELPPDDGWTGAEIRTCCELSAMLGVTLTEAAGYIVPVAVSAAEDIKALRQLASGAFISAAEPGVYQFKEQASPRSTRKIRRDIDADVMTGKGEA